MAEWLVAASVGPVGHFIGGGRRSRDLWWGSTWVSECTRTVAETLAESGARLLLPRPERLREIKRFLEEGRRLTYGGRVTNRLVAVVTASGRDEVARQVRTCETNAHQRLAEILEDVHRWVTGGGRKRAVEEVLAEGPFRDQLEAIRRGDFVEFYAAWTPLAGDLRKARKRVEELLQARKAARLFTAPSWAKGPRRKSDLDPGRDSVLHSGHGEDQRERNGVPPSLRQARNRLGIRPDEDLDAVGLARRIAALQGGPNLRRLPFPPLSRVAADPWLRAVAADPESTGALARVRSILEEAADDELFFVWCSPARDPEIPWSEGRQVGDLFPFDASILLEDGLAALEQEVQRGSGAGDDDVEQAKARLADLREPIRHLHRLHGPPHPYYGLLAMDGDGIGSALAEAPQLEEAEELVRALDRFADRAETIVRQHHGCAFYVGGDELTAYLPVPEAAAAALELARAFEEVEEAFSPYARVSLSGGLALAHAKADLRGTRARAREALASAKRRRAEEGCEVAFLEIRELPRSGVARICRGPLEELVGRLGTWEGLLSGGLLSPGSAHLLLTFRDRFAGAGEDGDDDLGLDLARHRLLAQSVRAGRERPEPQLEARLDLVRSWRDAESFAAEVTIAHRLLAAGAERGGTP